MYLILKRQSKIMLGIENLFFACVLALSSIGLIQVFNGMQSIK